MSLKDTLADDLKTAMRAGDEVRKSTLRLLLTAITKAEVPGEDDVGAARQTLDDQQVLGVISSQAKQRRQSIEAFKKAARDDLVQKEEAELEVLEAYLPAQLTRVEIIAEARKVMDETGASSPADKGKVMPVLMKRLGDRADGRTVNEVVTELLFLTPLLFRQCHGAYLFNRLSAIMYCASLNGGQRHDGQTKG